VWHDDAAPMQEAVHYLAALGHRRIAQVAGVGDFVHTRSRIASFRAVMAEVGLPPVVVETDYTPESGARATRKLLSRRDRPTAIVFDSDVLAVTGLGVAHQMGLTVPDDVSIVGWDDSLICQVVHPPLTAVTRDIPAYGVAVARRLLAEIDGSGEGDVEAEPGALTTRASTGRPAGAATHAARSRSRGA
jgi:DNA-binding LacI/PurR family transcriptional regulator